MDVLAVDGSDKSNDAMKDDLPTKVNGDLNGSVEGMEVEEESNDGDGVDVATDESLYGSSRAPDGDPEDPNSRFGSEGDGKSTSHFESENEGKDSEGEGKTGGSHFGSEYGAKSEGPEAGMDVDGLDDAEGESVNSEEEYQLLNSDNEGEVRNKPEGQSEGVAEDVESEVDEGVEDDDEEEEEEGDINAEEHDEPGESVSSKLAADDSLDKSDSNDAHDKTDDGSAHQEQNGTNETTPTKKKKKDEVDLNVTPRRSSRTVQKPVRFGQDELGEEDDDEEDEGSEVEEVPASDPLADAIVDKENRRFPRMIGNTTIVVSDTKKLADIAGQKGQSSQPKKEPTLVIIDTNSILLGRGGIPMQTAGGVTITQQPATPRSSQQTSAPPKPKPTPQILPTLTDDMYVVEAPSFIVPYVYEKPPVKQFKKYLRKMLKAVRKQEEEDDKREEEEEAAAAAAEEAAKKVSIKTEKEPTDEASDVEMKDAEVKGIKTELEVDNELKTETNKVEETAKPEKSDGNDDVDDSDKTPDGKTKIEDNASTVTVKKEAEDQDKADSKEKEVHKSSDSEDSEEDELEEEEEDEKKKAPASSYFDNPLGKFFMQIGMNLVQEFVQTDLLKQQKKKQKAGKGTDETQAAINSLKKNLILSKENNEPYTMEQTKCEFCSFRTESKLIMAHHLETPHMRNYVYRCNFCPLEVRGPHDILYHMEAEHCVRGRLERAPAFHQCPQCPFEDNQKGKLTRHLMTCGKKFRPEKNLEPPPDWEPPAKIPRLPRKPNSMPMGVNNPLYSQVMGKSLAPHLLPKGPSALTAAQAAAQMVPRGLGRGRPMYPSMPAQAHKMLGSRATPPQLQRAGMMYRNTVSSPVMLPSYPISNNALYQQKSPATVKLLNQPSISITPLPRQSSNPQPGIPPVRPGATGAASNPKTTFVICEICDGYIKDLEQLRNHMQWIHKVKIHPKMIYNRPPLNCQKCQFRFFTDQGLERHLLGSHGLVTSSMQDQANRGKDGGRCPVCGRVYQWKLLNHVARDHNMTLKPAHLSYKCTVCTATFGMYKQFENHVYSAHSMVAKRVMDKKPPSTSRSDTANLLKPLKINDEITIIPQPAKKPTAAQRPVPGNYRVGSNPTKTRGPDSVQVIDLEDSPNKGENGSESLTAVRERLKRRQSLEIRQLESEDGDESGSDDDGEVEQSEPKRTEQDQNMEEDDQATEGDSDE